ncbi:MAG: hypothetical protein ACI9XO_002410 [Paraglaciecola sp.]|jgi:hypothetical protein
MEYFEFRNRVQKVREYARQVLMEAPHPNFYSYQRKTISNHSKNRDYLTFQYRCRNIYGYATENINPNGNISQFFNDLEDNVTNDVVRFYIKMRKLPSFKNVESQTEVGFSAIEKILIETPDVMKGDENYDVCKPYSTKNLWKSHIYINYLSADTETILKFKKRINKIYQNSDNTKTIDLAKEILAFYKKTGTKTLEEHIQNN